QRTEQYSVPHRWRFEFEQKRPGGQTQPDAKGPGCPIGPLLGKIDPGCRHIRILPETSEDTVRAPNQRAFVDFARRFGCLSTCLSPVTRLSQARRANALYPNAADSEACPETPRR